MVAPAVPLAGGEVQRQKKPLQLESPEALPDEFRERLHPYRSFFEKSRFLDSVLRSNYALQEIADELDCYLEEFEVHAYHCTKEPYNGFFEARGLRLTDAVTHQREFLEEHGHRFTPAQLLYIKETWRDWFLDGTESELRDGQIWACLSRNLVKDDGTAYFFSHFGGEVINMPFTCEPELMDVFATIGNPVVVEFAMPGPHMDRGHTMSNAVLSQYHSRIRPDACPGESATCCRVAIPPNKIIRVTPLREFEE